ncbi:uncharacterized protein EAE97_004857 [Botrytis byssoidea]|uniref:Uncharacterized protein n=1 Tax=Botrytis byssoidea TaxID=139641 RepID=A0A9P5ILD1_9HELO|nr:uncharacterized protein EAE97_004857 [Botrytis byssoidea]KAF7945819.1 hypothetical protein EAE97_004857 [Botrytis byssoidea]
MPSKKDIEGLNKQQKSSGSQHSRSVANSGPPSYYSATMPKTPPRSVAALSEASFVSSSAPPSSKESKVSSRHAPSTASTKHHKAPSKASEVQKKDDRLRGQSVWNESDVYAGGDDGGPGEQSHHGDSEPAKSNHGSTHGGRRTREQSHHGDSEPAKSNHGSTHGGRRTREQSHHGDSEPAKSNHGSTHGGRRTREQSHHEDEGGDGDGERHYGMPQESSPDAESVGGGGQPYFAEPINDGTMSQGSGHRKPRGWQRDGTPSKAKSIIMSGSGRYEKKKDGSSKSMISGRQKGGENDNREDKTPSESGKIKTYSESGKNKTASESGKVKIPSESGKSKTYSESGKGKTPSQSEIGDMEPPELMGNGGSDYGGSQTGSRRGGQGYDEKQGKKVAFSSADNPAQPLDDIQECEPDFEGFDVPGGGRGTKPQVRSTMWKAAASFLREPDEHDSLNDVPRGRVLTDKYVHIRKASGYKPQEKPTTGEIENRKKIAHSWGK